MIDTLRALSALNYLDSSCHREEWIRIGMAAKSAGLDFEDFHNWSKSGANYVSEKDCYAAWKSFKKTQGITEATLFYLALQKGWHDPRKLLADQRVKNSSVFNYVNDIWERCLPALDSHEYIVRKQGESEGLRYYPSSAEPLIIHGANIAGHLVIPCWSNGVIQTLQFIPPNKGSEKLNLGGASFNDGYFLVGEIKDCIYICEGIAHAWAAYQASGHAAVVFFGASRMKTVVKKLRAEYAKASLVIIPDRGKEALAKEVASSLGVKFVELPKDKPDNYDINDYAIEFGYDELANLLASPKTPGLRYELVSCEDLSNTPPMRWLVSGVIPMEGLAALYGASGSGKSFLTLDMACAISLGEKFWFGHRVMQAPVTYVCLEGEAGMGKRIKAFKTRFCKELPSCLKFVIEPFDLLAGDINDLAKAIVANQSSNGLVIIDTLNRAAPGADENSSVDMGKIIAAAKKLQAIVGGIVLLVHHTGKDTTKGLRGHSSLYAALDGAIEVIKTDTRHEWIVAKSKDDITGNAHSFKLDVVNLGVDEYGDNITSCIVLFDDTKEILPKMPSLSSNQKIALKELDKQFSLSSHINKDGAPISATCLEYDEAVAWIAELMPTDKKHRKSRAKEAISGLIEKCYLGMKGDWLWRA